MLREPSDRTKPDSKLVRYAVGAWVVFMAMVVAYGAGLMVVSWGR